MSMNLTGRLIEFSVKAGATSTLIMNVTTASGAAKNMSSTATYATAKWKVWQPDGTLIIDGAEVDKNFSLAARNIKGIDVLPQQGANVYDILRRDTLVLTKGAIEKLVERLK